MLGNIGDLFVKCMTRHKRLFVPSVEDYYVMHRHRAQICETLAKITDWLTDPLGWICNFVKKFVVRGMEF